MRCSVTPSRSIERRPTDGAEKPEIVRPASSSSATSRSSWTLDCTTPASAPVSLIQGKSTAESGLGFGPRTSARRRAFSAFSGRGPRSEARGPLLCSASAKRAAANLLMARGVAEQLDHALFDLLERVLEALLGPLLRELFLGSGLPGRHARHTTFLLQHGALVRFGFDFVLRGEWQRRAKARLAMQPAA